ncbi:MAG: hypothetical protein AAB953_01670, partial [Patescibacteria group bacterium]
SLEPVEIGYNMYAEMKPIVKIGDRVKPKMVIAKEENQKGTLKADEDGKVVRIENDRIIIRTIDRIKKTYIIPPARTIKIKDNAIVQKGQPLTNGHLDLKELMFLTNEYLVQKYIMTEVQSIYASQGQSINDKHIEIIARQMLSKVRIIDSGDTQYLPGEIVDIIKFNRTNEKLTKSKKRAKGERLLLGLTRIALYTDSWLSAASFQETIRVLVEASTTSRVDILEGLKENVIIGKLIPAGETFKRLHRVEIKKMEKGKIKEEEVEEEDEEEDKKISLPVI